MFYEGKTLKKARKDVDSFWSYLYQKKENADWLTFGSDKVRVDSSNIDNYIFDASTVDLDILDNFLTDLNNVDKAVKSGSMSWQDYSNSLDENHRWIAQWGQETEGQIRTTEGLVQANQNARQAAIAHNTALKQQTLGAKAAKLGLQALATVGNMIVFTLISEGISKLMNMEAEALEKAQASYEAAVEEVNKLNEREDVALSSAKELSELFSDEDWGSESAKRASDIYSEMADRLEDVGGAEDDRIQQLRDEAKQIRENIGLSKEERLAKAEEGRKKALTDSGWDKQSNITKYEDKVNSAEDTFWKTVEKEFSSFWNMSNYGGNVHALSGNVLKTDGTATNPTDVSDEIIKTMGDLLLCHYDDGAEYVKLADVSGTGGSQYAAAIEFMKRFEKIQELPNVSDDALYKSLKEIYDKLLPTYSEINKAKNELPAQKAKKDAYDYFNKNGFNFDSKDDEDAFVKFLKDKKYDQKVIDSLLKDLENGGFYSEEYWKDIEKASGDVNKMTVLLSELEGASDKIKTLGSAFKELSDDGYVSFDTISKIKELVGSSVPNWDYYEKALLGAKLGTAQTAEAMDNLTFAMLESEIGLSELANADEEYIEILLRRCGVEGATAKSIEYKTRAQAKEKIQTALSKETTEDKVNALIDEAEACGIAKNAYIELVAQEILFGKTDMNFEEKINGLYDTAEAAGVLSGELSQAKMILDSINWEDGTTKTDIADQLGLDWKYETDKNGDYVLVPRQGINGEYLDKNGKVVDSADKAQMVKNRLYAQNINGVTVWHDSMTIPMQYEILDSLKTQSSITYTPSNSSGSDKNSALDNYLKAAENRYKIHQDETRYIEELNYAMFNLAKTEEEILDVESKINEAYRDHANNIIKDLEHGIDMKKEKYGDNVDVTKDYSEIQKTAKEEADRYREFARGKLGYYNDGITDEQRAEIDAMIEKTDEIQDNQKTWWDAENKKLDFYKKQHDVVLSDLEHAKDMALEENPYADVSPYLKSMQDEYHRMADWYRSLDPEKYKEEIQKFQQLWWDAENEELEWRYNVSQRYIDDRNTYGDWELFNDSEVEAWERVVKWLRDEYPNDLDKIQDAEKSLFEARKKLVEDLLNELATNINDEYDIRISRLNSQSSLLSSHFNMVNAIAEEQHNLNKELREAETVGARMSEQERETLFSKADHNKLSSKLSDIMLDITELQSDYLRDLERATEDTIEEVTNQYERQYELKMKEYEIVKAELNLVKKQQVLENTQNEKSVRAWNGSQWVYEANLQDVLNAQEEVENAKYELAKAQSEEAQQTALNAIDAKADALQTEKNILVSTIEDLSEKLNGSGQDITYMLQTLAKTDLPTFEAIIKAFGESIKDNFDISDEDIERYRTEGFYISKMKENSSAWKTADKTQRKALQDANARYADMLGLDFDPDTGRWKRPDGTYAYATGTNKAKKGLGLFDDKKGFGSELILTNDGILTQFNGGERVFSPEMADRLWGMAQQNYQFAPVVQPNLTGLTPVEDRINNVINNISNAFGDTYMIKDVQLSESEGGTLKGFINFLKTKV